MTFEFIQILFALVTVTLLLIWINVFYKNYLWAIFIGMILRLFVIFLQEQTDIFGNYDIVDYLDYFVDFAKTWDTDLLGYIKPHVPFYNLLYAGWIFNALGESGLWVIRVVNASVGLAIIAPLSWLNQIIFGKNLTQFQALIIAIWPTYIRHNIDVGRTAPSVFFVVLGISGLLAILSSTKFRRQPQSYIYVGAILVVATYLRTHYIAYFMPILSLALLNLVRKAKISPYLRPVIYLIFIVLSIAITFITFNSYQNLLYQTYGTSSLDSLDNPEEFSKVTEEGGSVYLQGIYPNTFFDWFWYIPLQGFYFMFSPMPWDIHSAFAFGSCLQIWLLLFLCIKSVLRYRSLINNNQPLKLLLISIIFSSLIFGIGSKNAGSSERWRLPSTLILITTTTSILQAIENKKKIDSISATYRNEMR